MTALSRSGEIDFNHFVTVQYVNIADSNQDETGAIESRGIMSLSMDMFYPAFIRMLGTAQQTKFAFAVAAGALSFINLA